MLKASAYRNIDGKVVKTVPMTKEEAKVFQEAEEIVTELGKSLMKFKTAREKGWAMVQVRLDNFGKDRLSVNIKDKEIEFRED